MRKKPNSKTKKRAPGESYKTPQFILPPFRLLSADSQPKELVDWGLTLLSIPPLWTQTQGEGVRVAVIDSGVAFQHPDLADAIVEMKDFTKSVAGPSDLVGHGTHIAGIIGARRNGLGVVGVAPRSEILVAKVVSDKMTIEEKAVVGAIEWACEKKARIINISFGRPSPSASIKAALVAAIAQGVFVICAAGNTGPNITTVQYPGAYEEMVCVGAVFPGPGWRLWSRSAKGRAVDIVAPGDSISSTYPPNLYARLSGTSMAAPFVTGITALILAKHDVFGGESPVTNQAQLLEHLQKTAIDLGPAQFDIGFGFGLINPVKLLQI